MTKADLIKTLAENCELSQKQAGTVLAELTSMVIKGLQEEGEALLPDLGKLKVKKCAARAGRNPQTGEAIIIEARNKASFEAFKALKEALNG